MVEFYSLNYYVSSQLHCIYLFIYLFIWMNVFINESGESECTIISFKFTFVSLTKSVVFLMYWKLVIFSRISSELSFCLLYH